MEGKPADARADIFSFSVALYEALYGARPFTGKSMFAVYQAIKSESIVAPPDGSRAPAWLRRAVLGGLKARPEERWASMPEMLRELSRDPARQRRAIALGAGAAMLFALSVTGAQLWSNRVVCGGGEEQLAPIWSDARRETVQCPMGSHV